MFCTKHKDVAKVAEHYKKCFGLTESSTAKELDRCGEVVGPGGAWYDAGVVLGFIHPNTGEIKTTGSLNFQIKAQTCLYSVMGPQSVDLNDPKLLAYAMDRCKNATRVLHKLGLQCTIYSCCTRVFRRRPEGHAFSYNFKNRTMMSTIVQVDHHLPTL